VALKEAEQKQQYGDEFPPAAHDFREYE